MADEWYCPRCERSLGHWEEIGEGEWRAIVRSERRLYGLKIFETLTDPDGLYGPRQVYTAWGRVDEDAPLIDVREYRDEAGEVEQIVRRKFVPDG